ncbi:hypothetical protein ACWOB6_07225 [Falseniella ignava]
MDFIHDRNSNIPFSLHDSRIKKITFRNNVLTLHLNKIFQYTKDGKKIYSGEVLFYDNDIDDSSMLIFDRIVYEGDFSGKAISLIEYMEEYSNAEFEILIEGYFGYYTTYTGWIRIEGKEPVSAILYIWNTGDMVYRIDS